ncbi:hypothetical protein ACIPVK_16250 [Paeniglutamicibacter sp. MACA_103]|uniref:hypothetical protein n=1 Tax=Paeniglutamicibacter sp. MACA_103 TaxID=3377337 RepID=UPI003892F903
MLNLTGFVPWPLNSDLTAYWTMWGTVATASVTALLALFAYRAWDTSKKTLGAMQKQARADLGERQESREISALADYLLAMSEVGVLKSRIPDGAPRASFFDDPERQRLEAEIAYADHVAQEVTGPIERNGMIWRLHHHRNELALERILWAEIDLVDALSQLHFLKGFRRAQAIHHCRNFVEEFATVLRDWQMNTSNREVHVREASELASTLKSQIERISSHDVEDDLEPATEKEPPA